ncbi:MAG TPA: class I SAM-dependent methyltransferase, partial [Clostridia bacterium]|nr:class I SAM-dependent methyltransferase [Clostridia bacterium]
MDLRLTFNEDAPTYDRLRPTYVDALFDDVIRFSCLDGTKRALEIGIGTGQATLPFLKSGCEVTAIEIGDKLARYSREKFAAFERFTVINRDFESVRLDENAYDLIYSASAFHWIPPEIGLPKVLRLLKSNGVFAWFSIQPLPAPEHAHIHEAVQRVYDRYGRFFGGPKPEIDPEIKRRQTEEKRLKRADTLTQYGFSHVTGKLYDGKRTFSAKDYVALLGT